MASKQDDELVSQKRNILMDMLQGILDSPRKESWVDLWKLHIDGALDRLDALPCQHEPVDDDELREQIKPYVWGEGAVADTNVSRIIQLLTSRPCHHEPVGEDELRRQLGEILYDAFSEAHFRGVRELDAIMQFFASLRSHDTQVVELKGRIAELEDFSPLYAGDHSKCPDPTTCFGYRDAQSDYDNEKDIRKAELQRELERLEGNNV